MGHVGERDIFLLDAAGALVSVVLLGVVLPLLEPLLGMPVSALRPLALWALVCLIYSSTCYLRADARRKRWLRGVVLLNSLYCVATALLVMHHFGRLTLWGVAYFVGEFAVILGLVAFELRVYRRAFGRH